MSNIKPTYEELLKENLLLKEKLNNNLIDNEYGLLEKEERYKLISSISNDYTFTSKVLENDKLELIWVAGAFEKITGYTIEDYKKEGGWRAKLHPNDIVKDKLDMKCLYKNKSTNSQLRTYNNKNEIIWVQVFAYPIWNEVKNKLKGIYGTVRDITEKKIAEEALKVSEEKYRTLIESTHDSIFIIKKGLIEYANNILYKISGYSEKELIGKPFLDFVSINERERISEFYKRRLNGDIVPFKYESSAITKSGDEIPVEVITSVFNYFGEKAELVFLRDISKDKIAESVIKASEEKYKNLLNFAPDAFFQGNSNGHFITVNNKAIELTGYSKEELLGKNISEIFSTHTLYSKPLRFDLLEKGETIIAERELIQKNGNKLYIEMISKKMPDNTYQAFMRDITFKKKAEQDLINSEEKYKLAFTTSPDAVNINKIDGTYVEVNDGFTYLTGYTKEDVIGKTSNEIGIWAIPNDRKMLIDTLNSVGKISNLESVFRKKDGSHTTALMSASLIILNNELHILSITKDISDRKKLENELIKSKELAEESNKVKSAFLATMSHELRTPLNAIIGFSEIINKNTEIDKIVEMTKMINDSGIHLLHIIESIFDLSLLQSKVLKINKEIFSLQEIYSKLNYYIQSEKKKLKRENLEIIIENLSEFKDIEIHTDKTKLLQLCSNLINNALKYTYSGYVKYGFEIINSNLKFYVSDSGIGIPKEKKDIIFDKFTQIEDSHTRKQGGVGLGLSICKEIVEILDGEIGFDSKENNGSTFTFILPNILTTEIKYQKKSSVNINNELLANKTIIIAEDVESNYILIKEMLRNSKANILWAKNGIEAIKYVQETNIDLILMDIRMPELDGYEATLQIKKINQNILIIAQTAYAMNEEKNKCISVGCDGYISKPFKFSELYSLIESIIN